MCMLAMHINVASICINGTTGVVIVFALDRQSHTNCYVDNYQNRNNDQGDASNDDPNHIKAIGIFRGFIGIFVSSITIEPPYLQ